MGKLTINDNPLIAEALEAVAYFVERQKLVARVMCGLDIDLEDVAKWGPFIWQQQGVQELRVFRAKSRKTRRSYNNH